MNTALEERYVVKCFAAAAALHINGNFPVLWTAVPLTATWVLLKLMIVYINFLIYTTLELNIGVVLRYFVITKEQGPKPRQLYWKHYKEMFTLHCFHYLSLIIDVKKKVVFKKYLLHLLKQE